MQLKRLIWWLGMGASGLLAAGPAAEPYKVTFEANVAMKTRDGVTLRADVYRPKADGRFPVLLERTPYNKYEMNGVGLGLAAAAKGYVCIIQDCRGRFASEGEWYPFRYESSDGYDTVEWAAALPYSNGKVGMMGGSYLGMTQMFAAIVAPPHLAGIMPEFTPSNIHGQLAYQGGAFGQLVSQTWCSAVAINALGRRAAGTALPSHWDLKAPPGNYPLLGVGTSKGLAPYYYDWLDHPAYDDYWKPWSFEEHYGKIKVPALSVGGWYDLFQDGSIRNYEGMKRSGGTEEARNGQRLILVPGGHAGLGEKVGDIDFGNDSVLDYWALVFRWYDYLLKGIDTGIEKEAPVKVFVMGRTVWRDENEWPLARTQYTRYYLHSAGKANTLTGDGALSPAAPAAEAADKYVYNPDEPTPTQGGAILGDVPPGPLDQRGVEQRSDVLVYTTPGLDHDIEVTGPVTLELYISSSAVDTDFTGKLVDVWPDGRAVILTDGILRMRYRESMEQPELMNPGRIYKVTIDLGSTANVFLAGHRLRLEVASCNFRRFDRNMNTGASPEKTSTCVKAENVIYHDRNRPSALVLPIIP